MAIVYARLVIIFEQILQLHISKIVGKVPKMTNQIFAAISERIFIKSWRVRLKKSLEFKKLNPKLFYVLQINCKKGIISQYFKYSTEKAFQKSILCRINKAHRYIEKSKRISILVISIPCISIWGPWI